MKIKIDKKTIDEAKLNITGISIRMTILILTFYINYTTLFEWMDLPSHPLYADIALSTAVISTNITMVVVFMFLNYLLPWRTLNAET